MTDSLPIEIARWKRSTREAVFVKLTEFNGTPLIEVRNYWQEVDGSWKATRKGLSLGMKHLPLLASALHQAEVKACEMGLLTVKRVFGRKNQVKASNHEGNREI
jgi:Transcriptional Coactivator p15 (PC4)